MKARYRIFAILAVLGLVWRIFGSLVLAPNLIDSMGEVYYRIFKELSPDVDDASLRRSGRARGQRA